MHENPKFANLKATFCTRQSACLVMAYVEGLTLYQYQLESVVLSHDIVRYCSAIALSMLEELHNQQIVYRDLKSENIIVQRNSGKLVLIDFGFAKKLEHSGRTFTKCGTPGYTAPEVLKQPEDEEAKYFKKSANDDNN